MNDDESTWKIGMYRVLDRIVDGRLWVAHAASRQGAHTDRAAIWMLRPDLERVASRTNQLVRQLSRLSGMNRPGLLNVNAIGTTTAGPYVVTSDARGETLDEYMEQFPGGLEPSEAVRIVLAVAGVLDEAHRRSLITHGALDPSKILVSEQPPRVVVRELGLLEAARLSGFVSNEAIGAAIVRCRAPEIDRSLDLIGPATDQYALASIAFELLTGHSDQGPRPSLGNAPKLVATHRSDLPDEVDFVLLRAHSHATSERYATINEFAAAFRRAVLGGGSSGSDRPSQWPRSPSTPPAATRPRSSRPPSAFPDRDGRVEPGQGEPAQRSQPPSPIDGRARDATTSRPERVRQSDSPPASSPLPLPSP
ncbi:MAG: protein kinase, partial [Deltaproteobacteria bacterium]